MFSKHKGPYQDPRMNQVLSAHLEKVRETDSHLRLQGDSRVFISYSWENVQVADAIERVLIERGINYFRDSKGIQVGDELFEVIKQQAFECTHYLLILSEASRYAEWCMVEYGLATGLGLKVAVLAVDDLPFPAWAHSRLQTRNLDEILRFLEARPIDVSAVDRFIEELVRPPSYPSEFGPDTEYADALREFELVRVGAMLNPPETEILGMISQLWTHRKLKGIQEKSLKQRPVGGLLAVTSLWETVVQIATSPPPDRSVHLRCVSPQNRVQAYWLTFRSGPVRGSPMDVLTGADRGRWRGLVSVGRQKIGTVNLNVALSDKTTNSVDAAGLNMYPEQHPVWGWRVSPDFWVKTYDQLVARLSK